MVAVAGLASASNAQDCKLAVEVTPKVLLSGQVKQTLVGLSPGHRVSFHGSVPAPLLSDAYLNASVLVLPSLCDGFGLVVSEALAHGLPVVTTTNAGAADLVEHGRTGFVIPPADEDALVETLQWCRDHPLDLLEMRRAALASARRWTWADFRRRQIDLLACALGGELASQPVRQRVDA